MAGAHSIDDGGLKFRVNDIFSPDLGSGRPLIADLAKVYGGHVGYARSSQRAPDSYWERVGRLEERTASIAKALSI